MAVVPVGSTWLRQEPISETLSWLYGTLKLEAKIDFLKFYVAVDLVKKKENRI